MQQIRDTARALRRHGYRLTPQRQMILDIIQEAHEHLSADEICQRVRERQPFVSLSTIYRTLELLKALDLVREVMLSPGKSYYEPAGGDHHHLLCRVCGRIIHVSDELLGDLRAQLGARHGFTALSISLLVIGYCCECQPRTVDTGGGEEGHSPG
jgi:Fe2+ or Zn2+ uptake regulation protein